MQLSGVNFSLSKAKRLTEEGKLMAEAATSFRSNANTLSQALGFQSYSIKTVQFNQQHGGIGAPPRPYMMKGAMAMESAAVPVPSEGGKSEVSVSMNGTVEMQR